MVEREKESGLSYAEQYVVDALTTAWNMFILLEHDNRDDLDDFRRSIHEAQRILAARVVARNHPEYWRQNGTQVIRGWYGSSED